MEQEVIEENIFIKPDGKLAVLHQVTKEIFNHIRNYLICLSLYITGKAANLDTEWELFGRIVVWLAILLALLYTTYLMLYFLATLNPGNVPEEGDGLDGLFLFTKTIFDHIRNYLICASLYVVGKLGVIDGGLLVSNMGKLVTVTVIPLTILNSVYVMSFVWTNFSPKRLTGRSSKGQGVRLILLSLYFALVYVIVGFTVTVKLRNGD